MAAVEVDRAAPGVGGVAREGAALDREVLAAGVDGAAVALGVVVDEAAGLDRDLRGVGVDGAGLVLQGPVVLEGDALDLALRVVAGGDAAAVLLPGDVGRDGRGLVADEVEVVVVEVDAGAAVVGANVGVVVDRGAVLHLDAGVLSVAIDTGAALGPVVADGAVVHLDGGVGLAHIDAATIPSESQIGGL